MNFLSKFKTTINISTPSWKWWPIVVILAFSIVAIGSMLVQFAMMMIYGEAFLSYTKLIFIGEMFAKVIMILLGIILIFVFIKGNKSEAVGWTRNNLGQIIFWGIISALVFNIFIYGWETIIPGAKENIEGTLQTMGFGKTIIGDIAFILTITVFAPIGEEILFRAVAFRSMFYGLAKYTKIGIWGAIIIAAILTSYQFGSIHLQEGQDFYFIIPYFILSLVFTFIYVLTNSLYTSIISHSINNSFVILMALFTFTKLQPASNILYILIFFGPIFTFLITYTIERIFFLENKKKLKNKL